MSNYIVTDSELTSVANAIRTKGGTNGSLVFPGGFTSAINAISGGGSSDFSTAEVTISIDEGVEIDASISMIGGTFDGEFEDFESVQTVPLFAGDSYTALMPLFKGKEIVSFNQFNYASATATGGVSLDIEDSQLNGFTVTGDGTITINYVE